MNVVLRCVSVRVRYRTHLGYQEPTYYFSNNALMYYAIAKTIEGVISTNRVTANELATGIRQAGEGMLLESIVYAHVFLSAGEHEAVFKYSDLDLREIDVVAIDRVAKTLRLVEVKCKSRISPVHVFHEEAGKLYDEEILKNIGVDDTYDIARVLVYQGGNAVLRNSKGDLLLANIADFLLFQSDIPGFTEKVRQGEGLS
ncbi:MAG: hypothetical protein LBR77_06950 [Lachnospiraceae bacterium]|nr:hypothetical protein [Lachnospiraceae bacterium]